MKCPLFVAASLSVSVSPSDSRNDCLGEECAWWIEDGLRCCIKAGAQDLFLIADELKEISATLEVKYG